MGKLKHFNQIADIKRHLEDVLKHMQRLEEKNPLDYHKFALESWGYSLDDKEDVKEELEVVVYLLSYERGLSYHSDKSSFKPTLEVANRCFNRHLEFIDNIFLINGTNVNKENRLTNIAKDYKACKHYLFQFSLSAWYNGLPDEIVTYNEKYNN